MAPGGTTATASLLVSRSVRAMCLTRRTSSATTLAAIAPIGTHCDVVATRIEHRSPGLHRYKPNRWQEYHHRSAAPGIFELQKRYFFSFFHRDDTKNNDRKHQDEAQEQFTSNTITNKSIERESNRDWEDQYRKPMTRELWNEFRAEGQRTRNYLSSPLSPPRKSSSPGYQQLALEMQATMDEQWADPETSAPPPEYGPTGKWMYRFEILEPARRVYHRYSSSFSSKKVLASLPEIVLELPPEAEILAMSLTPDEACVTCLLQAREGGDTFQTPLVKIRSVDSRKELILTQSELLGEPVATTGHSQLVSLEWGPILWRDGTRGAQPSQQDGDNGGKIFDYSLYLVLADDKGRPDRVALLQIDPSTLALAGPPIPIYSSDDPAFVVDVQRTKGCSCVAIRALSKTSSEVFLSPGDGSNLSKLILVRPKQDKVVYHVEVGTEGDVVLLTSDERHPSGEDYFLEETLVRDLPLPIPSVPPLDDEDDLEFFVEDMDLFRSHIVLYERSRSSGDQRVKVRQRTGTKHGETIPCPGETILDLSSASGTNISISDDVEQLRVPLYWSKLSPVGNMCFEASFFRFELESPLAAGLVYQYDFNTRKVSMVSGVPIGSSLSESHETVAKQLMDRSFRKEKILVESSDGTKVPLSLFYKEDKHITAEQQIQTNKIVVLVGYGAYGEPIDLGYNPGWRPLLERGAVIAFAHTRGGGDLGRAWYASGRGDHKIKGIEDYEACAFHLRDKYHNHGISSVSADERGRPQLVAKAFSAGGVLVGACVNKNPGLFDKVILTNAFVDVYSTMSKASLFLTEHEYDEFGNPTSDSISEATIRSYCPIYNLDPVIQSEHTSTQFLLIGTLDDPNVPYWNASLYFRKLSRGKKQEGNVEGSTSSLSSKDNESKNSRVFLELQTEGGHHFSGQNRIEVLALENAFILKD